MSAFVSPHERLAVAVIAPSGPFARDELEHALAALSARGCAVSCDPRVFAREGYLAGADGDRADALRGALSRGPEGLLWAARGGYGAMRVIEHLGLADLARAFAQGPTLVGFSDLTALHALASLAGRRSIHGVMLGAAGRQLKAEGHAPDFDAVLALAHAAPASAWEGLTPLTAACSAAVEGPAWGGNLAMLSALGGTGLASPPEGAVLYLEDIGEAPYRIDRMLTQLSLAGTFARVRAVVFGDFTGCDARQDGITVEMVLTRRFATASVPVLRGAPFGHGAAHRPWVQGARVRVSAREGRIDALEGVS